MEVGLIHLVMSTSNVAHNANPTAAVQTVPTGPVELGQAKPSFFKIGKRSSLTHFTPAYPIF